MNEKEQTAADKLLEKLNSADGEAILGIAQAYNALAQGACNRANAERVKREYSPPATTGGKHR